MSARHRLAPFVGRSVNAGGVALVVALFSTAANAYPTMIRHGYTQCATCHVDPSGGTLLSEYGRAQSQLLLSSSWGAEDGAGSLTATEFLFGAVPTPPSTVLGGWLRNGYIWNTVDGKLVDHRFLQMRADVAAAVRAGPVRAAAELGYASPSSAAYSELASLTRNAGGSNAVSREHWIGLGLAEDAILLRAGRINLPFGLRNLEHTSFVRTATRTDINQDQQDGVALSLMGESWRGEAMAILGNYSVRPDALRERGASAYVEVAPSSRIALGVSAMATRAEAAIGSGGPQLRQSYGLTARAAPWTALVLSAEADALISTALGHGSASVGYADWLQADLEVVRGVHLLSAVESSKAPGEGATGLGLWGGVSWFVIPHLDVRADAIRRSGDDSATTMTFLLQLNGYL